MKKPSLLARLLAAFANSRVCYRPRIPLAAKDPRNPASEEYDRWFNGPHGQIAERFLVGRGLSSNEAHNALQSAFAGGQLDVFASVRLQMDKESTN